MNLSNVSREDVLLMMDQKEALEAEIRSYNGILASNGDVGMHEALVDSEGYPRPDIDIFQVRVARNKIICLQNDHKALMKRVEEGLHSIHASSRSQPETARMDVDEKPPNREPFARINLVSPGSPAEIDGMKLNDMVVEFGSVSSQNFKSLQDLATVVQHSVGQPIIVKLLRQEDMVRILLTPRQWSGRGMLGCNFMPIENVDR